MTAARSTLGDGRARTTKPSSATAARATRARRRTPIARATANVTASTTLTFSPETASRWVRPVSRMSAVSVGGTAETSPSTRPGNSPRSSAGSPRQAPRSAALARPASRCHQGGRPTSIGGPRASSTAATSSPRRGGDSRPADVDPLAGQQTTPAGAVGQDQDRRARGPPAASEHGGHGGVGQRQPEPGADVTATGSRTSRAITSTSACRAASLGTDPLCSARTCHAADAAPSTTPIATPESRAEGARRTISPRPLARHGDRHRRSSAPAACIRRLPPTLRLRRPRRRRETGL